MKLGYEGATVDDAVATDTADNYDRRSKSADAHDTEAIDAMIAAGSVFVVDKGTRVRVIDQDVWHSRIQVRFLSGSRDKETAWMGFEAVDGKYP